VQVQTGTIAVLLADGALAEPYASTARNALQHLDENRLVDLDQGLFADAARVARRCVIAAEGDEAEGDEAEGDEAEGDETGAGCKTRVEAAWAKQAAAHQAQQAVQSAASGRQTKLP